MKASLLNIQLYSTKHFILVKERVRNFRDLSQIPLHRTNFNRQKMAKC